MAVFVLLDASRQSRFVGYHAVCETDKFFVLPEVLLECMYMFK